VTTDPDAVYTIAADEETTRRELERLHVLARWRDPFTIEVLEATGVGAGWRCLEVGAGAGTISAWLGRRVGSTGSVLSTDIDLRFHDDPPTDNIEVREHDITRDPLPADHFDLVHVRAVLQHVAERELVLDRLIEALKPGGWLVAEEADMRAFEVQPLVEPLAGLHQMVCAASASQEYRDPNYGTRLLAALRDRGMVDLTAIGHADTMRGGEDSAEWWFLAVEHVRDRIVGAGVMTDEDFDTALAQARAPGFAMLGPLSIAVRARKP
jgi:SAM-dependent methyltransferase